MPDLAVRMPIIPHESHAPDVDCCGCLVVEEILTPQGSFTKLSCNECGALLGMVSTGVLDDMVHLIERERLR